jgi:SAM-dependent methyltransferase
MRALDRPAQQPEQMDAADLDPATYARILTDLAQVNRWTFAARPTLDFVARAVKGRDRFSLLDVGFGDGDLLRAIARWARKRGIRATLTGIDLNPRSAAIAAAATPRHLPIDYRTGDYRAHVEAAEADGQNGGFDLIVSSLVAHHMTPAELHDFLRVMEEHARIGWHINDLHRHRFAYIGFPLLARTMRWHRIVREDGQLSIARAFRPREWPPVLAEAGIGAEARVRRRFPFRICVERLH